MSTSLRPFLAYRGKTPLIRRDSDMIEELIDSIDSRFCPTIDFAKCGVAKYVYCQEIIIIAWSKTLIGDTILIISYWFALN